MKRLAWVVAMIMVGCTGMEAEVDPQPDPDPTPEPQPEPDPEPMPDPEPEPEPEPETAEAYDLVTEIDISASALLPQTAYEYYDLLRRFREDPADTIIFVLDEAGVPLVRDLYEELPSYVESRVSGWVNEYVNGRVLDGTPVGEHLDLLLEYGEMSLTTLELLSRLDLSTTPARHVAVALRFHIGGETIDVPIPADAPAPFAFDVPVDATISGDDLVLGDHTFGIEYGRLAWLAFEEAVRRRYGTDLRGVLARAIDCPAFALSISTRCYYDYCVGHEEELEAICEAGLDELVAQARQKVEAESFDALHLIRGDALIDADSIDAGVWSCEIDVGQGPRSVAARFTGIASHQ